MKKVFYCLVIFINMYSMQGQDCISRPVIFRDEDQTYDDGILSARSVPKTNIYEAFRWMPRITSNDIDYHLVQLDPYESHQVYKLLRRKYNAQKNEVQEVNAKNKTPHEVE